MKKVTINCCGKCNSYPIIEEYFELKTLKSITVVRCPICHEQVQGKNKKNAIEKWNYCFPQFF